MIRTGPTSRRRPTARWTEAIKRVAEAYGHVDTEHIITDWVVIGAGIGVRPGPGGGETALGFYLLYCDEHAPPAWAGAGRGSTRA